MNEMKIRVKETGKELELSMLGGYDKETGITLIYPINMAEILLDEQPATLEQSEPYDYEALRNELAAKLYTMAIKKSKTGVALARAIKDANEFIRQLKKSPVE